MNDFTGHELGWDDEIADDSGQYFVLEEGDYDFTVTGFERGRFPGSTKIPACNKAILTLAVRTGESKASVTHEIILWSSLEWKLSEFLRAIGQKRQGEPCRPRWNEMVGATGRAHFKPRTYKKKDGTDGTANNVDRFYDAPGCGTNTAPTASAASTAASAAPAAAPARAWQAGKF